MNLLDTIRSNNQAVTQAPGITDETSKLQGLLRAKSGRATAAPSIGASNLGEQSAVNQTAQTVQNQVKPQLAIQNQALKQDAAGIEQQNRLATQDITQQNRINTVQDRIQTEKLLNSLEQSEGQLDMDRDKATINQLATNLRMQNTEYVDNLQREGARSRLDDELQFKQELASSTFGKDNLDLLQTKLGNQSILSASDRDFKKAMANLDINTAYDMFKNDMAASKERSLYSSLGALATAGVGAYGAASESADKKDYYTTGGGKNTNTYEASQARK